MGFYFLLSLSLRLSIIITRLLLHHFFEEFSHIGRLEASCLVSFKCFQHGAYVLVADCCIEFEWSSLKLFPELSHMKKRFCPFEWYSISNLGTLCYQLLFPFVFCFLTLVWSNLQQAFNPPSYSYNYALCFQQSFYFLSFCIVLAYDFNIVEGLLMTPNAATTYLGHSTMFPNCFFRSHGPLALNSTASDSICMQDSTTIRRLGRNIFDFQC